MGKSSGLRRLPAQGCTSAQGACFPRFLSLTPGVLEVVAREGGVWNKQNGGQIQFEGF